jgi:hypothetical protein
LSILHIQGVAIIIRVIVSWGCNSNKVKRVRLKVNEKVKWKTYILYGYTNGILND